MRGVRSARRSVRRLLIVAASVVASTVVGHGGDLPFTHPFGDDLTFNLQLDAPYAALSQKVGPDTNDIPAGAVHTEIPEGLLPQGADGQIQPDFIVKDGDRVAA